MSGNDAGKYTCQVGSKSLPVQLIALGEITHKRTHHLKEWFVLYDDTVVYYLLNLYSVCPKLGKAFNCAIRDVLFGSTKTMLVAFNF